MVDLLQFAAVEFLSFFLANLSIRYCAKGRIAPTVIIDVIISLNGFWLIKLVAEPTGIAEMAAFLVGGALGSLAGMLVTRGMDEKV